jgi:hypothetical protein
VATAAYAQLVPPHGPVITVRSFNFDRTDHGESASDEGDEQAGADVPFLTAFLLYRAVPLECRCRWLACLQQGTRAPGMASAERLATARRTVHAAAGAPPGCG